MLKFDINWINAVKVRVLNNSKLITSNLTPNFVITNGYYNKITTIIFTITLQSRDEFNEFITVLDSYRYCKQFWFDTGVHSFDFVYLNGAIVQVKLNDYYRYIKDNDRLILEYSDGTSEDIAITTAYNSTDYSYIELETAPSRNDIVRLNLGIIARFNSVNLTVNSSGVYTAHLQLALLKSNQINGVIEG